MTQFTIDQLRRGEPAAEEYYYARFAPGLIEVANNHIATPLRRRLDGEDLVQSVFRSVFRRIQQGQFALGDSRDLCRLLVGVTKKKACDAARTHTAARRDRNLERGFGIDEQREVEPRERFDAIMVNETLELLFARLRTPQYIEIVKLLLAGKTKDEVASEMNVSRRTVERALIRVRTLLSAVS